MYRSTKTIPAIVFCLFLFNLQQHIAQEEIQYTENAIKVFADGSYIMGKDKIANYYSENPMPAVPRASMAKEVANAYLNYEMNAFVVNKKAYKEVVITTNGENPKRDFEFVVMEEATAKVDLASIKAARKKWVELCNAHNADALIEQLYHDPTLYYNHRPPVTSKAELAKLYSYMNNPAYNLDLKPIHTAAVADDLALEIGQCSGSYPGKYIIIWKKHPKFGWQVLVDSNI